MSLDSTPAGDREIVADPFDLASLRVSQDFASLADVRPVVTTIPVRRPGKERFVRAHRDPERRMAACVIELKEQSAAAANGLFLVSAALREALAGEKTLVTRLLVQAIDRQGALSLWPIRLPRPDGRADNWALSEMEAVDLAQTQWVRVSADMSLGAFTVVAAPCRDEPKWPDLSFQDVIKIAFRDRMIDRFDHPVLRRLRGED